MEIILKIKSLSFSSLVFLSACGNGESSQEVIELKQSFHETAQTIDLSLNKGTEDEISIEASSRYIVEIDTEDDKGRRGIEFQYSPQVLESNDTVGGVFLIQTGNNTFGVTSDNLEELVSQDEEDLVDYIWEAGFFGNYNSLTSFNQSEDVETSSGLTLATSVAELKYGSREITLRSYYYRASSTRNVIFREWRNEDNIWPEQIEEIDNTIKSLKLVD